jgi:5'-3' exonuclease
MGVPFYFKKIFNNYPQILEEKYNQDNPYLFLDFNGIIHQCSHKIINNDHYTEDDIFQEIKKYIFELNEKFNPKLIYAAIDGVAPISKIKQQRQRRFKTVFYQNYKNNLYSKYNQKINNWNSNCITPGTQFMINLNKFLKTIDLGNLIISDSDEKGEGEHKMFNYIKNNDWIDNIIIHGLDADLIFLSLLSNIKNIIIFRDNNSEESFLNIDILKSSIISDLKLNINFTINDDFNLIKDYILICFLLGNDFLPKINSLDIISNNGLNIIEETYINILNIKKQFLIQNNLINHDFFKSIIQKLSENEVQNLNNANYKYINKKYFNKPSCNSPLEIKLNKFEFYPLFNKTYIGYNNIFDWKIEYYNHYFKNIKDKNKIVEQYLIGIQWILDYYLNGKSVNNWYYPYLNSPLIEDIYNYLNNNKNQLPLYEEKCKIEITPNIQLLLVLPKSSHNLLPTSLQNVYYSELKYLYPTEFYIDTHLNTYLHQCIPFIPNFNIKKVYNYILNHSS